MAVYKFLAFKDLYIQTNVRNKFLKKLYKTLNFDLTHKHHVISMQYRPHKYLPKKYLPYEPHAPREPQEPHELHVPQEPRIRRTMHNI